MLDELLVRAVMGEYTHLAIQFPPRHGKSTECSEWFPAWHLGMFPDKNVILTTHEADFAASFGERVRNIVNEHGPDIYGVKVDPENSARNRWKIEGRKGGMLTAGVGGSITGRGADLLICDDPIKSYDEAMSPTMRDRVWNWWKTTAYTRREPGAICVVIMTRWHKDDLIGCLTNPEKNPNYADWKVVDFPAIATGENDPLGRSEGEALWPERYPIEELEKIRSGMGSAWFGALFQQKPEAVSEGTTFKSHWFEIVDEVPAGLKQVRYWDRAAAAPKHGKDPDYNAGAKGGVFDGTIYITDMKWFRDTVGTVEKTIVQTANLDGVGVKQRMEQEGGSSGIDTINRYRELLMGFDFDGDHPTGNKEERAGTWAGQAEAGNVKLVRGNWNIAAFLDELDGFPFGNHDDQVDAVSGMVKMCSSAGRPVVYAPDEDGNKTPNRNGYDDSTKNIQDWLNGRHSAL